jgi:hypothetical protein
MKGEKRLEFPGQDIRLILREWCENTGKMSPAKDTNLSLGAQGHLRWHAVLPSFDWSDSIHMLKQKKSSTICYIVRINLLSQTDQMWGWSKTSNIILRRSLANVLGDGQEPVLKANVSLEWVRFKKPCLTKLKCFISLALGLVSYWKMFLFLSTFSLAFINRYSNNISMNVPKTGENQCRIEVDLENN